MRAYPVLIMGLILHGPAWAFSKPYDTEAAAVLREGKPCFYLPRHTDALKPAYSDGQGIEADVYEIKKGDRGLMWHMWMKQKPATAPASPETCMMYGIVSPDQNRKKAIPLRYDVGYGFSLMGVYGRNMAFFCLRRDPQGKDYLAKSDHQGNCSTEPLLETPQPGWWQKLFGR